MPVANGYDRITRFAFSGLIVLLVGIGSARAVAFLQRSSKRLTQKAEHEKRWGTCPGLPGAIGNTPLIKIASLSEATGCEILGKAEYLNAAGQSPKDRVALNMIEEAEAAGLLKPHSGYTIYEGTMGSTGISLAAICRAKGYNCHIVLPDWTSPEKTELMEILGAVVEKVPAAPIVDPENFANRAQRLAQQHTDDSHRQGRGFYADQFHNSANWRAHYKTTGPEILEQTANALHVFVSGAGTGGTIAGVSRFLKEKLPEVKVVLADVEGSGLANRVNFGVMFASAEREGTRRRTQVDSEVEGMGLNRMVGNFEEGLDYIDEAITITDEQARLMGKYLVEHDGLFLGSTSAINMCAALIIARRLGPGHRIVTVLCDSGTRHMRGFWRKRPGDDGLGAKVALQQMEDLLATTKQEPTRNASIS